MLLTRRLTLLWTIGGMVLVGPAQAQTAPPSAQTPVPRPGPAQPDWPVDPRLTGVPIYPGADLLASYDAGRGQRTFVFGTNMPYADILAYYKSQFRTAGRELFKAPAMQQFDLGRFQEDTMAYPPSVVVKDYAGMESPGYLHIAGTTEKRYKTIIQIVPVAR